MTPKRLLLSCFVLAILLSACSFSGGTQVPDFIQPTISPSESIADYFPLRKGAYWIYQGPVKWTETNTPGVLEDELTWKMEVERVFQRNAILGYEMNGAPWDLTWYEAGKQPSKYGIIQAGGQFYTVPVETVIRLMNEDDNLFGLVDQRNLLLDIPLMQGKKFCDTISIARPDNMYCWNVGAARRFDTSGTRGVDPSGELWEYPIGMGTMPDAAMMYFVPGLGITRYLYRHHGTVSEVDVHLIEFHPGE